MSKNPTRSGRPVLTWTLSTLVGLFTAVGVIPAGYVIAAVILHYMGWSAHTSHYPFLAGLPLVVAAPVTLLGAFVAAVAVFRATSRRALGQADDNNAGGPPRTGTEVRRVLLILITWLGAMALMYGILAFTFFDLTSSLLGPLWWVVPIGLLSVLPAAILEWRRQSWGAVGLLVASCLVGAYCVEAWTSGSEHADNACIVFWCIVLPGLALGMVLLLTARR